MIKRIFKNKGIIGIIFVMSFFVHSYFFASRVMNGDYLGDTIYPYSQLILGRFMPLLFSKMIPPVLGILLSLGLSFSFVLLIEILEITQKKLIIALASIIITFPALAHSFPYMMNVERVALGIFFSVMAVFVVLKLEFKFRFLLGGIFLALSIGEYQSYLGVAICLSIIYLIIKLLKQVNKNEIFRDITNLLGMGICGIIFYWLILKVTLTIQGVKLANYRGLGQFDTLNFAQIKESLILAYANFLRFFAGRNYIFLGKLQYIILGILMISLMISLIEIIKQNVIEGSLIALLIVSFPMGVFVIDLVSPQAGVDIRQIYQLALFLILPVVLLEKMKWFDSSIKWKKIFANGILTVTLLLGFNYYLYTNAYYTRIAAYSEQTTLLLNRIWSRIEEMDEYNQNKNIPLLLLMDMKPLYEKEVPVYPDYVKFDVGYLDRFITFNQLNSIIGTNKFVGLMHNKLGIDIIPAGEADLDRITRNEQYLTMGIWPEKDSIKAIDNIIVVNFKPILFYETKETKDKIKIEAKSNKKNVQYAFYLYEDGEILTTQWYSETGIFEFSKSDLKRGGQVSIEIFCIDENGNYAGHVYIHKMDVK